MMILELSRAAYAKWVPVIGCEPLPLTADYHQAVRQHIIDLHEEGGGLRALIEMVVEAGIFALKTSRFDLTNKARGLATAFFATQKLLPLH